MGRGRLHRLEVYARCNRYPLLLQCVVGSLKLSSAGALGASNSMRFFDVLL